MEKSPSGVYYQIIIYTTGNGNLWSRRMQFSLNLTTKQALHSYYIIIFTDSSLPRSRFLDVTQRSPKKTAARETIPTVVCLKDNESHKTLTSVMWTLESLCPYQHGSTVFCTLLYRRK